MKPPCIQSHGKVRNPNLSLLLMAGGGGQDIELNLGLAVAGSATATVQKEDALNLAHARSPRPNFLVRGGEPIPTDPDQKKKYHAQRRKEARQKQEEKLMRRGIFRAKSMVIQSSTPPPPSPSQKSPTAEYTQHQSRFVDRKGKESEAAAAVLHHHRDQQTLTPGAPKPNQISTLNLHPITVTRPNHVPLNVRPISVAPLDIIPRPLAINKNLNPNPNPAVYGMQAALPVMQMHLSYKPMAMVPYGNNYAIPWLVPCWAPLPTHKAIYSPNLAIQPLSAVQHLNEDTYQVQGHDDQEAISKSKGKGVFSSTAAAAAAVAGVNKASCSVGAQNSHGEMVTGPRTLYVGVKRNDGTTLTGYLHKYWKPKAQKVRIVCTCHERKMTPAEFLKHAGRVDQVEDPLNHIVMLSYPC